MKYFFRIFSLLSIFLITGNVFAESDYLYRQRVNWVKLDKADSDNVPLSDLKHPYTISVDQMEAMLLSIKIDKKYLLKKGVDSLDVFNAWEARKYASLFVDALAKANNDQVVNFSVVHKRPTFILRNDRLTMGNVFAASDGVHFQFTKLFAPLEGDYEASAEINKAFRKAKTIRVSLAAGEGQVLSYTNQYELIMNPSYNFASSVQVQEMLKQADDENQMKSASKRGKGDLVDNQATVAPSSNKSATERLKELDALKTQKLISEGEYQQLRKKILSEL